MPLSKTTTIPHLASLVDVQCVLGAIMKSYPECSGKGPYPWSSLAITRKTPPPLASSSDVILGYTTVTGHLGTKMESIQSSLASLLGQLNQAPASTVVGVTIGFEEKESKQTTHTADAIEWRKESGSHFFMYAANGSKVRSDADYRQQATQRLIHDLKLPLAIRTAPDGFTLGHTADGKVQVHAARGLDGKNPTTFSCELTMDGGLGRIETMLMNGLAIASSGKLFHYHWFLRTARLGRPPGDVKEGGEVLDFMRASGLTATKYHVGSQLLINDLRALESLRMMFAGSDSLVVQVGAYKITDAQFVNVSVRATDVEYAIELESNRPLPTDYGLVYTL